MKKSIDSLAQRIFASLCGLALVIFACGTLVNNPVKADSPAITNTVGKIMMDQNSMIYNGKVYYHFLVWDTETGKSKLFWFNDQEIVKVGYQLPSSPLY